MTTSLLWWHTCDDPIKMIKVLDASQQNDAARRYAISLAGVVNTTHSRISTNTIHQEEARIDAGIPCPEELGMGEEADLRRMIGFIGERGGMTERKFHILNLLTQISRLYGGMDNFWHADLFRDIVPQPEGAPAWFCCDVCGGKGWFRQDGARDSNSCRRCGPAGVAVEMATDIRESGDWDAMPVLADIIEENGSQNDELLRHLRSRCEFCNRDGMGSMIKTYEAGGTKQWSRCDVVAIWGRARPHCGGTGVRKRKHTRQCWAIRLVLGLT